MFKNIVLTPLTVASTMIALNGLPRVIPLAQVPESASLFIPWRETYLTRPAISISWWRGNIFTIVNREGSLHSNSGGHTN